MVTLWPFLCLAVFLPGGCALEPSEAVSSMVDYILSDTKAAQDFKKWGYGQSIMIDAMLLASEKVRGMEYVLDRWVNPVLDQYLTAVDAPAYNLTHGLTITPQFIGNAVGDKIGLYPHAYLHRHEHYRRAQAPAGYNASADLEVARRALDDYILKWPRHWTDGTVTRDFPGQPPSPWGPETDEHQFVWGDDAYMGLTLPARMVKAGFDDKSGTYAQFVATQHALFAKHLHPTAAEGGGIFWHGRNAKTGAPSCCKWGRANGWTMMTHIETLTALSASAVTHPFAAAAITAAKKVFVEHASAIAAVQNVSDGRWHQLLNDTSQKSFLETSCTAMFTVAMVTGVDAGWLDSATFNPVIDRAWKGLSRVIHKDGYVTGMCDGFGIHGTPQDYYGCRQLYDKSHPGLGSVLKAAVLLAARGAIVI